MRKLLISLLPGERRGDPGALPRPDDHSDREQAARGAPGGALRAPAGARGCAASGAAPSRKTAPAPNGSSAAAPSNAQSIRVSSRSGDSAVQRRAGRRPAIAASSIRRRGQRSTSTGAGVDAAPATERRSARRRVRASPRDARSFATPRRCARGRRSSARPAAGHAAAARGRRRTPSPSKWSTNWRHDGRYDWHNHRNQHRSLFHFGFYYDPFGWGYQRYRSAGGCGRAITAATSGSTIRGCTACPTRRRARAGSAIMTTLCWSTRGAARWST